MKKQTEYNQKYADITGTFYKKETPIIVCDILEKSRISHTRLKIYYGDIKTGKEWGDVSICHVGRSTGSITGSIKIPLEIKNSRSTGGGALLDDCIVKIEHANKKNGGLIYKLTNNK